MTPERPTPHAIAWPLEKRREMMRDVVARMAKAGEAHLIDAPEYAKTYGPHILACEVEAEMMRHLSEGEGK